MKLATFLHEDDERWGFVMRLPGSGEERLVEPARAEAALAASIIGTSGYSASRPTFRGGDWPGELAGFLALGDTGLAELARLAAFLERYHTQSDATVLDRASHRLDEVELLAPVPRPRLYWGLVANAPSFARNALGISHLNLFPLGHQRPQGSVIGDGAQVLMKHGHHDPLMSFNVELGVVIGTGGRYIELADAMRHVAGFTTVTDVAGTYYYGLVPGNAGRGYSLPAEYDDWFFQATASWGGKIADTMAPTGPFLVTKDEIGDPYDLLVYTRQNGRTRNRAHTAATILGIERVIHWYSSFATLHPGDVIHFGTMGVDGLPVPAEVVELGQTRLESEIEDVGVLSNPVHLVPRGESVPFDRHPSHAVRRAAAEPAPSAETWRVEDARHLFTAFGNHAGATDEGLPRLAVPRFLTAPASSLGASGATVELPPRATELEIGIELAVVIGQLAADVERDDADRVVLALRPLISICDRSFRADAVDPVRPAERQIHAVYGRWGDGFNVMADGQADAPRDWRDWRDWRGWRGWRDREMTLIVGDETIVGSTSDYLAGVGEIIETISAMTTLFPGDVITLGSTSARIVVDPRQPVRVTGAIAGLGEVVTEVVRPQH